MKQWINVLDQSGQLVAEQFVEPVAGFIKLQLLKLIVSAKNTIIELQQSFWAHQ